MTMHALDLCAGAGGLSLGLAKVGLCVDGVELDPEAAETYRMNVGPCDVWDISTYHPDGLYHVVGGGVPCQPFSLAGKRAGTTDERGRLYEHVARIGSEACADVVFIENVRGFMSWKDANGVPVIQRVSDCFESYGFPHVHHSVLDAVSYGVPQFRKRVIVIGFRNESAWSAFRWPEPTHAHPRNLLGLAPYVTVRQALGLSGAFRAGHMGGRGWQGKRAIDVDRPSYTVGTRNNADFLACLDEPSPTIVATEHKSSISPGSAEGRRRRRRRANSVLAPAIAAHTGEKATRLTLDQLATLQGLPSGFVVTGKTQASRHRQIGDMVPPALGEAVGRSICRAIKSSV